MFPGSARLRDSTQLERINAYRRLAAGWGWSSTIEDPLPLTGDLRAFDLVLHSGRVRIAHEFVSRLHDLQAQVRPILRKQRDAGVGSLVVVVKDTMENRRLHREAGRALDDHFPLSPRDLLQSIRHRRDPGANGILFWRRTLRG